MCRLSPLLSPFPLPSNPPPPHCSIMCRLSGFVSMSAVDFGVVTRYFYFQVGRVVRV